MGQQTENQELIKKVEQLQGELKVCKDRFDIFSEINFEPIVITSKGIMFEVNKAAEKSMGYTRDELLGTFIGDKCVPESLAKVMENVTSDDELTNYELEIIRKDGSIYPAEVKSRKIKYKGLDARVACVRDVTHRKVVENQQRKLNDQLNENFKKLEESQKRLKVLSKLSTEGIVIHKDLYIVDANDAFLKMMGYQLSEVVGQYGRMFTPDNTWHTLVNINQNRLNQKVEVPLLRKDKSIFYAEVSGAHVEFEDGYSTVVLVTDVSERRNSEEYRVKAVIQSIDSERKRIAQELHDGLGQSLIAVSMQLDYLINNTRQTSEGMKLLKDSLKIMNDAIDEGRQISHDLMPKSLADFGLKVSLEDFVNKVKKTNDIDMILLIPEDLPDFQNEIKVSIFRIIQESMNNVIKHANANRLTIQVMAHDTHILVTIEDNGVGFDTGLMMNQKGLGFTNIKSRAFSIGANVEINSSVGRGTDIMIEIPLIQ